MYSRTATIIQTTYIHTFSFVVKNQFIIIKIIFSYYLPHTLFPKCKHKILIKGRGTVYQKSSGFFFFFFFFFIGVHHFSCNAEGITICFFLRIDMFKNSRVEKCVMEANRDVEKGRYNATCEGDH